MRSPICSSTSRDVGNFPDESCAPPKTSNCTCDNAVSRTQRTGFPVRLAPAIEHLLDASLLQQQMPPDPAGALVVRPVQCRDLVPHRLHALAELPPSERAWLAYRSARPVCWLTASLPQPRIPGRGYARISTDGPGWAVSLQTAVHPPSTA